MKGKLCVIGVLFFLGIAMISGCSGVPTKLGEDWKFYKNETYGYSFMYPSDCFFGPMPSDCKDKPPEQRRSECLCFLDTTNPDNVFMQAFLGEGDHLTLAILTISHYDTPVFNPPAGIELIAWLKVNFSGIFETIPDEANLQISGLPAVRLHSPQSPMAPSYDEIYYMQNGVLFRINMLDIDNETNSDLYRQILSTFSLEEQHRSTK